MEHEPPPCKTCSIALVRLDELEKRLEQGDRLHSTALKAAQEALDVRLESMNEFRSQIRDQTGTFVTRTELYWAIIALSAIIGVVVRFAGGS